jgi:hypothetical protein
MDRLYRSALSDHSKITGEQKSLFDPKRPWNRVWTMAIEDSQWWRRELEEQALIILNRSSKATELVTSDAPGRSGQLVEHPTRPQASSAAGSSGGPARKVVKRRTHEVNSQGRYSRNRAGHRVCEGYQDGTCSSTTGTPKGYWCANTPDPGSVHVCNLCLGGHPASQCTHKQVQIPGWVKRAQQKGETKGSGKGKKGGRRPQY